MGLKSAMTVMSAAMAMAGAGDGTLGVKIPKNKASKYTPHQGEKEKARRLKQQGVK